MHIIPKLSWQLDTDAGAEIGPGLLALLAAIQLSGSLRKACALCGVSYRGGWGHVKKWQQRLGEPLVDFARGRHGGARLSPLAERLLELDDCARQALQTALQDRIAEFDSRLSAALGSAVRRRLRMAASHDLIIANIAERLMQESGWQVDLQTRGSEDALRLFVAGDIDVAGFHVPLQSMRYVGPGFFGDVRLASETQLLPVAIRDQGLMVRPETRKTIGNLADLCKRSVRFVNRQRGSGTRYIFDQLLQQAEIDRRTIAGYNQEEFTHTAVAARVASGDADAGFGLRAAAGKFGLAFLPLVQEIYILALRDDADVAAAFETVLIGSWMHKMISSLPGYHNPEHIPAAVRARLLRGSDARAGRNREKPI